jgi:hypothetical protein
MARGLLPAGASGNFAGAFLATDVVFLAFLLAFVAIFTSCHAQPFWPIPPTRCQFDHRIPAIGNRPVSIRQFRHREHRSLA